jgi:Na+-transporting NADH:ubiquinone oxidoreductase subunit D
MNPLAVQVLGICSALAVTNRLENALVMAAALTFVAVMSNLAVSCLRTILPRRIRMIVEVTIIATFVILFDLALQAFYWPMSRRLGPYVGLIITNCIIMGRAEAFALHHRPHLAVLDGLANGAGYAIALGLVAVVRELAGTGRLSWAGRTLLSIPAWRVNLLAVMAPGAFLVLGFWIALFNWLRLRQEARR